MLRRINENMEVRQYLNVLWAHGLIEEQNGHRRHSRDRSQNRTRAGMSRRRSRCCIGLFDMDRMYISSSTSRIKSLIKGMPQEILCDHGIAKYEMG